jgi:hypothetical protein
MTKGIGGPIHILNLLDEQGKTYTGIDDVPYSIMAIQSDTYLGSIFFYLTFVSSEI